MRSFLPAPVPSLMRVLIFASTTTTFYSEAPTPIMTTVGVSLEVNTLATPTSRTVTTTVSMAPTPLATTITTTFSRNISRVTLTIFAPVVVTTTSTTALAQETGCVTTVSPSPFHFRFRASLIFCSSFKESLHTEFALPLHSSGADSRPGLHPSRNRCAPFPFLLLPPATPTELTYSFSQSYYANGASKVIIDCGSAGKFYV